MAAVTRAVAATQADLLSQGIAALQDKDSAQQARGVSYLESVIQESPTSPEAGTACYRLGCYYKADRDKSLAYFKQAYGIRGKDQANAGISIAHTLVATGKRLDAGAAFAEVGERFPDKAQYACYRAGMCYLGESRDKADPSALRKRAKDLFSKSAAAGNAEAQLQLLGMRWEDCDSNHSEAEWATLMSDLETYARDTKPPAYARARAFLMIAEHKLDSGDAAAALTYTSQVLGTEFKGCRIEQAWALDVEADALEDLGRWDEVVAVCDQIYSGFTDSDNFRGNNVRACALDRKASALKMLGRQDESAAVLVQLRQEYPAYAQKGGL